MSSVPDGPTTACSSSISGSAILQAAISILASVRRVSAISQSNSATASIRAGMLLDRHRIVAQLPAEMPSERFRPNVSGFGQAFCGNVCIRAASSSVTSPMVRSAFLAARREFSSGRPSSLTVNFPVSLRPLSSRLLSRSVGSFGLEVKGVQPSLQPPTVPGVGVHRGQVVLALARHFQARLPERGDDIEAVFHHAVLDPLDQVVSDQVAGGGFEPEPGPQSRRLDVGAVSGLLHPGPGRIVRTAPAVLVVEGVAERVERSPPARRGNVEAAPGLKVASRSENVDVGTAALLAVEHRRPCVAVGFEPRPSRLLEGVQNRADLFVGRLVLRCPRDHAGGVPVLEAQSVRHRRHPVGIAPKDLDAFAQLPGRVPLPEEVLGRSPRRSGSARQELNVHRLPGSRRDPRR